MSSMVFVGVMMRRAGALGLLCLLTALPVHLAGQSEELARVDRLIGEGRFGEARTALEGWLDGGGAESSREDRQHGLWLRAVLTIDPGMAELDLRRLVVEYPGGSFSDEALLRLAHAARLRQDDEVAADYLEILVRDYPDSPHRVEARALLSRLAAESPGDAQPATPSGPTAAGRGADAVPRRDDPPTPPASREEPTPADPGPFTVQVGAFSTEARAHTLALELREAGFDGAFEPRVVRLSGSELARVRIGGFAGREEAQAFAGEVRERGFEAVVSSDREREEPFR